MKHWEEVAAIVAKVPAAANLSLVGGDGLH